MSSHERLNTFSDIFYTYFILEKGVPRFHDGSNMESAF